MYGLNDDIQAMTAELKQLRQQLTDSRRRVFDEVIAEIRSSANLCREKHSKLPLNPLTVRAYELAEIVCNELAGHLEQLRDTNG